jgi:flagellar motor protein MotB
MFKGVTFGKVASVVVLAAMTLGLTGCNDKQKVQVEQLTKENQELAAQNTSLQEQVRQAQATASSAMSERDTAKAELAQAKAAPAPVTPSGGDYSGGGGGGGRDVVITVAGDVLFGSGQVAVKASAKGELDKIARQLNGQYAGHPVRVEGFTDSTPIKKSKYKTNEALSQARAESVMEYLASKGVSRSRLSADGRGATKLKSTPAASRRVEIVVLAK